ncbi:MAG: hypothetical protein ACSHW0_09185 [Thalassotalea sp.]
MRNLLCLLIIVFLSACSTTYSNQAIIGLNFPAVSGQSLAKKVVNIPEDFRGRKTLLLLGYKQNSQFDIDRWLIGLDMTQTQVDVYELPTIQGMLPRMFKTTIDNGMRAGIPKELWRGVVTIYQDGDLIQAFTGNEQPNNARVILLNEQGSIIYAYHRGFSVGALNQLRSLLE